MTTTDITTSSRVIAAVEASLTAKQSADIDALRSAINEIDAQNRGRFGVGSSDYISWSKVRDYLFNFLAK